MLNFAFVSLKRWFQSNSGIVGTHFANVTTLNNLEMIAEICEVTFSDNNIIYLSLTSCLLKLPITTINKGLWFDTNF